MTATRFLLPLALVLALAPWVAQAHEEHGTDIEVGATYPMSVACDAYGANEVAKANLSAGTSQAGDEEFTRLADADPPHCYFWGFPVPLTTKEVTYAGTQGNLHVVIVKFGKDIFAVATRRLGADPTGGGSI